MTAAAPTLVRLDPAADFDAVTDLYRRAADYVILETGEPPSAGAAAGFFADAPPGGSSRPPCHLGARLADGRLVGIAAVAFGFPDPCDAYIGLLLIDPDWRGKGLGARMVAELADVARAAGSDRLLAAVLAANPRAHRFWRARGFADLLTFPPARIGAAMHVRTRMARPLSPAS